MPDVLIQTEEGAKQIQTTTSILQKVTGPAELWGQGSIAYPTIFWRILESKSVPSNELLLLQPSPLKFSDLPPSLSNSIVA